MTLSDPQTSKHVVLVTGAGKRLGRHIALHMARSGWDVAIHYRQSIEEALETADQCRQWGGRSHVFAAEFDNEASCRSLLPKVISHFGRVDAVVNNAAVFEHDDIANFRFESMERHWKINTGTPLLLAQELANHSAQAGHKGVIVNLLDQKLWNINPDFLSYTLSKAALEAATRMLALALAPKIRVVGIAPGLTLTSHMLSEARFTELHQRSPLGKSSSPDDVASAVEFAIRNQSITGSTIMIDGGQHLMHFDRDFSWM